MESWKKFINAWNISKQEEHEIDEQYKNVKLLKISFPEFWIHANKNHNNFYKHVLLEAEEHVKKGICGKEYLKEGLFKELWHRHCTFCLKEIEIGAQGEYYCTKDIKNWICCDCYNAYKKHFGFHIEEVEDIPSESIGNIIGIVTTS